MRALWAELKRRNVIRMAVAYCALSWLLLQVASMLIPTFDIPNWVMRMLVLLAVLGFPFALLFSWSYSWTSTGLTREIETTADARPPAPPAAPVSNESAASGQHAPAAASIAVLPLVNMSSDKEQDYFSDGLSEELLNLLAQVPGLHVAGRTSSFSFKDKPATITQIGHALNVATVLEGSVRKAGERVRITAQLIKVADGYHLWSQTYDRELTDIFAVQDEIAAAVVDALKLRLLPAQQPTTAGHHIPSPQAYNHFLLGRQLLNRATEDGFRRAVQAFGMAVALEPGYAAALAGLALAEAYAADHTESDAAMMAGRQRASEIAEQAVACDPMLGEAYTARAVLRFVFDLDWNGGDADFSQALVFNPGDVMTHWQYSRLLAALGRLPEALSAARQATELDPLSAQAWEILARYQLANGDTAAARRSLEHALDIAPDHGRAPLGLGMAELLDGDPVAARGWYASSDDDTFRLAGLAMAEHDHGDDVQSRKFMQELVTEHAHDSAYQIAGAFAWRGEHAAAFDWLHRAVMQHDAGLQYLKYDPALRSLRGDPRYRGLLLEIGLPA
jgi:TolB-like protein